MPSRVPSLVVFLLIVMGGGFLVGFLSMPGPWYESLQKPWFNPPNWVFGPAWTVLYVLIAIAGWRIWTTERDSAAMRFWVAQLVLNFVWTPVFFTMQAVGLALAIVLGMLACILAFIATAWRIDRPAALLFAPYALWVAFASTLNAAILVLN
jgi:tryptophan-rich sensory protein